MGGILDPLHIMNLVVGHWVNFLGINAIVLKLEEEENCNNY